MDPLEELEFMAQAALQLPQDQEESDYDDVKRWQHILGYSYSETTQKIQAHRSNLSRISVTTSHWGLIRQEKEAEGYDKEAYEYACGLATSLKPTCQNTTRSNSNANSSTYLFKLEGPFGDMEKVKSAAGLSEAPLILSGADDHGDSATFCKVDAGLKDNILSYLI
ncbi:hypothetical protein MGN70_009047 [Eutypa lata]|nr:hypothetical protein MGN70_009047 [Eutypa lata]